MSPPNPHIAGRVSHSTPATAMAASKALPPRWSTCSPAAAARFDREATMPFVP